MRTHYTSHPFFFFIDSCFRLWEYILFSVVTFPKNVPTVKIYCLLVYWIFLKYQIRIWYLFLATFTPQIMFLKWWLTCSESEKEKYLILNVGKVFKMYNPKHIKRAPAAAIWRDMFAHGVKSRDVIVPSIGPHLIPPICSRIWSLRR